MKTGLRPDPEILYNVAPTFDGGYAQMTQLLHEREKIETVFCGCDMIAIGAMESIFRAWA